jgi:hypothetical protein
MKKNLHPTVKLKKDFVSILAVSLFAIIAIFELGIIYWLPAQLDSDEKWRKEVAIEEVTALEDQLRAFLITTKGRKKHIADEIDLVKDCLDDYALYLRENKTKMTHEQTENIHNSLLEFEKIYQNWKNGKEYAHYNNINDKEFLNTQLSKLEKNELSGTPLSNSPSFD